MKWTLISKKIQIAISIEKIALFTLEGKYFFFFEGKIFDFETNLFYKMKCFKNYQKQRKRPKKRMSTSWLPKLNRVKIKLSGNSMQIIEFLVTIQNYAWIRMSLQHSNQLLLYIWFYRLRFECNHSDIWCIFTKCSLSNYALTSFTQLQIKLISKICSDKSTKKIFRLFSTEWNLKIIYQKKITISTEKTKFWY